MAKHAGIKVGPELTGRQVARQLEHEGNYSAASRELEQTLGLHMSAAEMRDADAVSAARI